MRRTLIALICALPGFVLAQLAPEPALKALRAQAMPGTEPLIAEMAVNTNTAMPVAAIVRTSADSVALLVAAEARPGVFEIVARSRPFTVPLTSNYGTSIELFRFNAPDRLELALSSRSGCARGSVTHRFAFRQGTWAVTGLDVETLRCTDSGVEPDWNESANYISGKAVRTVFGRSGASKSVRSSSARKAFPLSEFPPKGPETAYAELQ